MLRLCERQDEKSYILHPIIRIMIFFDNKPREPKTKKYPSTQKKRQFLP